MTFPIACSIEIWFPLRILHLLLELLPSVTFYDCLVGYLKKKKKKKKKTYFVHLNIYIPTQICAHRNFLPVILTKPCSVCVCVCSYEIQEEKTSKWLLPFLTHRDWKEVTYIVSHWPPLKSSIAVAFWLFLVCAEH